jgi:hypothetical protein
MTDRPFDRIAEAFLATGPTVLPDRVLDAAFEEVHRTHQRRVPWRTPWRTPIMHTYAKLALAGVAVIAIGLVGWSFLGPTGSGGGGAPVATPTPTIAPSPSPSATPSPPPTPAVTAAPLTGQFTSERHGYSIAYPETWFTRPATVPWISGFVDFGSPAGDVLYDASIPAHLFLALASRPIGEQTLTAFDAEVRQALAGDDADAGTCTTVQPMTIDGEAGVVGCNVAVVTAGGRGYFVLLYTSGDEPWLDDVYDDDWFRSVLTTMQLDPADARDDAASPTPS